MNSKIRSSVHNIFTYIEVLHTEIKYQNDRYQEWSEGDFKPRKKPAYQIARNEKFQTCCNQYDTYTSGLSFLAAISANVDSNISVVWYPFR